MGQLPPADPDVDGPVDEFVSVSHLIEEPGLARLYTYVLRHGPVTADEIIDDIDASPWGTEVHLEQLESLGVVTCDDEATPARYTAEPVSLRLEADGRPFLITPTFMGGVAKLDEDDELRSFVQREGYGQLAVALAHAARDLRGGGDDADREPLEEPAANRAVIHSLSDVADELREVDPYFDDL